MIKVFTTFTGIGSPEMALRNIGVDFEMVGMSEVDKNALLAYDAIFNEQTPVEVPSKEVILKEIKDKNIAYNFSTGESEVPKNQGDLEALYSAHIRNRNYGDIRVINEKELPDFDLFTYSFPCKDISVQGLRQGFGKSSNTASSLLWECERIIHHKKPKYLMMENVKNLSGKSNIQGFTRWIGVLSKLGYNSYWEVLNGSDFGVPQNRERVIMVSILKEEDIHYNMPAGEECTIALDDILEKDVADNFFLDPKRYEHFDGELPSQEIAYCIDANYHKGISVDEYIRKRRRQLVQVGCADKSIYSSKRVYSSEGIAPTMNSMTGGDRQPKIFKDFKVRRLTPLECWRLMGYTDEDFYKAKEIGGLSNSKLYERAGRGIVVPMLEAVFNNLFFPDENVAGIEEWF